VLLINKLLSLGWLEMTARHYHYPDMKKARQFRVKEEILRRLPPATTPLYAAI
jgi:hypothetical protein